MDDIRFSEASMQVAVIELRYVEVKKSARDRLTKAEAEGLCVACLKPLGSGMIKRGCHESCYQATRRAIQRGLATEADRVAAGKLREAGHGGRKPSNPVTLDVME